MPFRWNRSDGQVPALSSIAVAAALCVSGTAMAQAQPQAVDSAASTPVDLGRVFVHGTRLIDIGPLPGLAITKDQIPANIQSATKEQIKAARSLNIGDYMNTQLQGVSVNDYSGNPFQMDVNYRGFTASPQVGTPQGLSVFFDGVRVNEPFGDVVNWDLIPTNAIERFDLFPGSNPLFGLNTLGGAISVRSKSGFTSPGLEASVLGGSWGRKQVQLSGGKNNGTFAGFAALNLFSEDGWRDNSPSNVRQFYGRGDWALDRGTITASVLAADNRLVGNGLIPTELYNQRAESVFTAPDVSKNKLTQFTLSGAFDVSATQNITTHVYHRQSDRDGLNGDIYEGFQDFSGNSADVGDFVDTPDGRITRNGAKAGYNGTGVVAGTPIGLLTRTSLAQKTDGATFQYNWNLEQHKAMVGVSIDRSRAQYDMSQRLGLIDAAHTVYADAASIDPLYYAASHDVPGNDFDGSETTKSLYASETWSPRSNLHFTAAARYNHTTTDSDLYSRASAAQRDLHELRSTTVGLDELVNAKVHTNEGFRYTSFNPSIGVNWLPMPDLNVFGNLSRGSRVPSVVELGCAFDSTPVTLTVDTINGSKAVGTVPRSLTGPGCSLPTTLSGDPYLPQIRSTSGEVGVRGKFAGRWEWNASTYRTELHDDIYFVGVGDGKSFFDTIGKTRRQGLELGLNGGVGPVDLKLDYSYTDATFQSQFYTLSPHNSSADFDQNSQSVGNLPGLSDASGTLPSPTATANGGRGTYRMIRIDPGSRLPGVPEHALNGSLGWRPTDAFKVGLGIQIRSDSFVRGNENNQQRPGGDDGETGLYVCADQSPGQPPCTTSPFQQNRVQPARPFRNSGRLPGYAIFSLDSSYRFGKQIEAFVHVANLFDRRYATAGRLGVNPFSPSVNGAIGPSGWNYNSSEWQNTTYVGPGSPRGIWVGLSYDLGSN